MADNEKRRPTEAEVKAAVERMNKEAGYDVAVAFRTLEAMTIQEHTRAVIPNWKMKTDVATAVDVVVRANGGRLTANALSMLMDFAVAYGYGMATEEESILLNEGVKNDLLAYTERDTRRTVEENMVRKEGLLKGFRELAEARRVCESKLRTAKLVKG